ncbi:MAG: alpha/beta hydrolase [Chloroflexota bacterium]|nr:alpha/beta hydrolase [Chloroflexota bacterium]
MQRGQDPEGLVQQNVSVSTGMTLNVVERPGEGMPVVCLHGVWDWWRYWRPLVPPGPGWFEGRPLLMLDLRGHGDSSKPESGYTWADYAADVVAFITAAEYAQVTLVGHSLGALTALLTAAQMPERVASLVLEDPPLPLRSGPNDAFRGVYEMRAQTFEQIVDDFTVWRPWTTRQQAEESATCLLNTADGVFQAMFADASDGIRIPDPGVVIDAPALVIRAGNVEQRAFRDGGEELLRSVLPQLRVETIPDTSHTVLRDAPDAYRALLADVFGG